MAKHIFTVEWYDPNWYVRLKDDADRTVLEVCSLNEQDQENFSESFDPSWDSMWGRGIFLADWYYFYLDAKNEEDAIAQARELIKDFARGETQGIQGEI